MNNKEDVQLTLRQEVRNTENLLRTSPFFQDVVNCAIFHNMKKLEMESFRDQKDYFWTNPMITFSDNSISEFDLNINEFIEEMALPHHLVNEELETTLSRLASFGRYVNALNKDSKITIDENGVVVNLGLNELELDTVKDTKEIIEQLHKINDGLAFVQQNKSRKSMKPN